ncbi:MAG: hypothetical protein MJA30_24505, partial [Cytophagales bacterium]|nr:hypothetical protein [Cytophagales bacterium]
VISPLGVPPTLSRLQVAACATYMLPSDLLRWLNLPHYFPATAALGLHVYFQNIAGVFPVLLALSGLLASGQYNVIALAEMWLDAIPSELC